MRAWTALGEARAPALFITDTGQDCTDWANAVGLTPLLLKLARRLGRETTKEEVTEFLESLAA